MTKPTKSKVMLKKVFIICIAIYIIYILLGQQKTLNSYKNNEQYYISKIEEQEKYKKQLMSMKENVNSTEYIEEMAREKLDMYLPHERIYIDIGK